MRISDWSSDVCSSDLFGRYVDDTARVDDIIGRIGDPAIEQLPRDIGRRELVVRGAADELRLQLRDGVAVERAAERTRRQDVGIDRRDQIGRASCRERVCKYV